MQIYFYHSLILSGPSKGVTKWKAFWFRHLSWLLTVEHAHGGHYIGTTRSTKLWTEELRTELPTKMRLVWLWEWIWMRILRVLPSHLYQT